MKPHGFETAYLHFYSDMQVEMKTQIGVQIVAFIHTCSIMSFCELVHTFHLE
jgi:hypothetical protein